MQDAIAIFSHDPDLSSSLEQLCDSVVGTAPDLLSDVASLRSAVTQQSAPSRIIVDLRPEWVTEETDRLFDYVAHRVEKPIDLLTVSDGYYPRKLARAGDMCTVGNIDLPLREEHVRKRLAHVNGKNGSNGRRSAAVPRVVTADGISITTYSPAMSTVLEQVSRVAVHDVTLLLVGETGTGKSTLAHLIHQLSKRRDRPFHTVACGALPRDLIESELFGHVRGAFTGADRNKIGRFEAAGQGTLLLDEIDVLGPKEQAKLLRVIETSQYEMVGSTETRTSQARLIVASNVDLETLMNKMQFRSDLYYRLNVLEFRLPPLRKRVMDIVPMALSFIDECSRQHGIRVDFVHREFLEKLKKYHWPGNLRELKNQMQRSVLFCDDGRLKPDDLSETVLDGQSGNNGHHGSAGRPKSLADRVASNEQRILEEALRQNNYKRTATARALGISRVGLYKKMRKYGLLETAGKGK